MILNASNILVRFEEEVSSIDNAVWLSVIVEALPVLGVDRQQVHAWGLGAPSARTRKLAERMKAAILSGAVFQFSEERRDVNGKSYISSSARLMGRRLNADLKALGF